MTEAVARHTALIDARVTLHGVPAPKVAVEVWWTEAALRQARPLAFVCLPGGSINRNYYDLGGETRPSFSFAR
jgi:hypothetical protein